MRSTSLSLILLLLMACAAADQSAPRAEPALTLSAQAAAPGETIRVSATGFPPGREVVIGAGPPNSEYEVLQRVQTSSEGSVSAEVRVPQYAADHRALVFVVATPDNQTKVISDRVMMSDRESPRSGAVTITGTVTTEGVECPAVRTADDQLYTIAGGDRSQLKPGARVRITGTIAEISFCMQGTTISATKVELLE